MGFRHGGFMSSENDRAPDYKFLNEIKKEQKNIRMQKNKEVIRAWLMADTIRQYFIEYTPYSILFRFPEKQKVDFFPSTNRWRSKNITYRGDAESFLSWYNKQ